MPDDQSGPLRVDFVTGVTPDKWARTWARPQPRRPPGPVADRGRRRRVRRLRSGATTLSLLRLPIDQTGLHVIPLYEEAPVVVVAKEHAAAAFDDARHHRPGRRGAAAARRLGAGLARRRAGRRARAQPPRCRPWASSRRSQWPRPGPASSSCRCRWRGCTTARTSCTEPVTGVAGSRVGLAWRVDDDDPRIEDFIGVVRGRTERSSRGRAERDGHHGGRIRRAQGHRTAYRLGAGRHAPSLGGSHAAATGRCPATRPGSQGPLSRDSARGARTSAPLP